MTIQDQRVAAAEPSFEEMQAILRIPDRARRIKALRFTRRMKRLAITQAALRAKGRWVQEGEGK